MRSVARQPGLQSLIKEYGRNPERIIKGLGYGLYYANGKKPGLAGVTAMMNYSQPTITINMSFFEESFRFRCDDDVEDSVKATMSHELGHGHTQKPFLRQHRAIFDGEQFYVAHTLEREANIFGARLLIDINELEECVLGGYSYRQMARELRVPVGFVVLRMEDLKNAKPHLGIMRLPRVRDDFMACLKTSDESDDLYE